MLMMGMKGTDSGHQQVKGVTGKGLVEAGRDLAVINSIPVEQFGWIRRDSSAVTALEAELPTYRAFVFEQLEEDLAFLSEHVLNTREIMAIQEIIDGCDAWLDLDQDSLSH